MKRFHLIVLVVLSLLFTSCSEVVNTVSDWVHGLFPERVISDEEAERLAKDEDIAAEIDRLAENNKELRESLNRQWEDDALQVVAKESSEQTAVGQSDGGTQQHSGASHDESRKGQRDANGHVILYEMSTPYFGGTMYCTFYEDGSSLIRSETPCLLCNGTGVCNVCRGVGSYFNKALLTSYPCPGCLGSTACKYCQGTGGTKSAKFYAPGEAEAYMKAKEEERSHSSSSSSSESSSTCSKCGGTGVDPFPSSGGNLTKWVAYYHRGDGRCQYCSRYEEHYHAKCPRCNVPR